MQAPAFFEHAALFLDPVPGEQYELALLAKGVHA